MPIERAVITMTMSADRLTATNGTIAGIMNVEVVVETIRRALGNGNVEFCGPNLDDLVRSAADIMMDGTQDPSRICDGISIGLGFEAVRFTIDSVGSSQPIQPDTCP